MYICPKCNTIVDISSIRWKGRAPQCGQQHVLKELRSVGSHIAGGIGFTLLFFFLAGFWIRMYPDSGMAIGSIVLIVCLGLGIKTLVDGINYSKMPDPTRRLARQNLGFGWAAIITFVIAFAIGLILRGQEILSKKP